MFFCSALCLTVFYISMQFYENVWNSFKLICGYEYKAEIAVFIIYYVQRAVISKVQKAE